MQLCDIKQKGHPKNKPKKINWIRSWRNYVWKTKKIKVAQFALLHVDKKTTITLSKTINLRRCCNDFQISESQED